MTTNDQHHAEMLARLQRVASSVTEMLGYWHENDLPGDYLSGESYPFTESLEEVQSSLMAAVDALQTRDDTARPRDYVLGLPVVVSVAQDGSVSLSVDTSEVVSDLDEHLEEDTYSDEEVAADRATIRAALDTKTATVSLY